MSLHQSEGERPTKLTKRHSLDPKVIVSLESSIMRIVSGVDTCKRSTVAKKESFSMEDFFTENDAPLPQALPEKKSCCTRRAVKVKSRKIRAVSEYSLQNKCQELLPPPSDPEKVSLVLDLDETLIHSGFTDMENPDFRFRIQKNNGVLLDISVAVRPGARELLEALANDFELIIFTAGTKQYADYIIDQIDPNRRVKHRLYKESCVNLNGCTVKDLSLLNRPLRKIVIIDNSPISYLLQPYNSIPIDSWIDDREDTKLYELIDALEPMKGVDDVYSILVQS